MKAPIDGTQRLMRVEAYTCSATAITENTYRGTFTDNGTGDFTITFLDPFQRAPVVTVTPLHATLPISTVILALSTTAVRVAFYTASGAAIGDVGDAIDPTSFCVIAIGSDSSDGQI